MSVPSFNLPEIERRRDRLVERVFLTHYHETVDGRMLDWLTRELRHNLPAGIPRDTVFESIRYLAGRALEPSEVFQLAWRLSGNVPKLRAGRPVRPWTTQSEDEWVPLQVIRTQTTKNNRGAIGSQMYFRVLAGTPCPMRIMAFWKDGLVNLAARKFGFTAPWRAFPFSVAAELVGLRFLGKIIAARSNQYPSIWELECPDSLVTWNRRNVLDLRFRRGKRCPRGWEHECHRCVIGYEACPAGTHFRSYVKDYCDGCNKPGSLFDPETNDIHCIQCSLRERLRRQT